MKPLLEAVQVFVLRSSCSEFSEKEGCFTANDFQHCIRNAVRSCQDCQGTYIAIEFGHSGSVKFVKVRLLQLNLDTAELSSLSRYVCYN
jgi:hypothetical protein